MRARMLRNGAGSSCLLSVCWPSPAAGHRIPWREILHQVRRRLHKWFAGDLASLWSEACADTRSLSKRAKSSVSTSSQRSIDARRARVAVQNGQLSKTIQALSSEGLASPPPMVIQEMRGKHPQARPPILPHGPVPLSVEVSEQVVHQGVKSFPNGSAPGPSGLRPSHLREALGCPSPDRANQVLTSLTLFVNLLASGRAPSSIAPTFVGLLSLRLERKTEVSGPSQLRRCSVG